MELFTVNPTLSYRREALIEKFESFIWTDRFAASGDLNLVCEPSQEMYDRLAPDTLIGFTESNRLMRVVTRYRSTDKDGRPTLKIVGESIEAVFEGRAAKLVLSPATWDLTGQIGAIMTTMVSKICVEGAGVTADDIVPGMTVANLLPAGSSYTVKLKAGTLYERLKELADAFDVGFRITYQAGVNALPFEVYAGADRTGPAGVNFGPKLDNLGETSYLDSLQDYKTGAYVYSANGSRLVGTTGDTDRLGLKRRILLVDATDITTAAGADLNAALDQRGRDALSEHQRVYLYDGKVNGIGPYMYNQHYFLGDKVSLLNDYGVRQSMRVTEHIWSYSVGELSSYPTLSSIGGV